MNYDDWSHLVDELTPELQLSPYSSARVLEDLILVDWYGHSFVLEPGHVFATRGKTLLDSLRTCIDKYAPITRAEVEVNGGYIGYGKNGWNVHVSRHGRCMQTPWNSQQFQNTRFRDIAPDDYTVSIEGSLVVINSEVMCPCSILALGEPFLKYALQDYYSIDGSTTLLTTYVSASPVFIGHHKLLSRMSVEMDIDHAILAVDELQPPRRGHVLPES